ncbi:hypothetical protein llap_4939 [Limosa lapponica baueri]|uniref:Uncharacterized protein n=1 Tax=Limosa lapponica baueri TaxID=1758121 RepID=A0A2I0UFD9_LIMLA|nr:hypothetical protein llap_4939 [Limosa lapponica baueri]
MLCKNKVMCQGMSRKKGHVISETGESSMSLCAWSGSCCWYSPEVQVLSWAPPEEPQAVGETFGFLKRIHLGSTQSSPCVITAAPTWEQLTCCFHSYPLTIFTLVENKKGRVMSRANQVVDRVRKGPESHLRNSGRKPGVNRRENWNQETWSLSLLAQWTLDQVVFTHQTGFSFIRCPVKIQWSLPSCTDDAALGGAAQTSCPRKAACSFRSLLSLTVRFPDKKHLPVNLPMVQMSVWNHNDIYQRGLETVTGGLQIMNPMPFPHTWKLFNLGCWLSENRALLRLFSQ